MATATRNAAQVEHANEIDDIDMSLAKYVIGSGKWTEDLEKEWGPMDVLPAM